MFRYSLVIFRITESWKSAFDVSSDTWEGGGILSSQFLRRDIDTELLIRVLPSGRQ
jgi:hypothetical protein